MQQSGEADDKSAPLGSDQLKLLQRRSDLEGLTRWALHLLAIGVTGGLYALGIQRDSHPALLALLGTTYGFTLVTQFAAMHECVHRTAFETRRLNDAMGWLAGLLSFYNSTFYRYYHGWHHRYTQLPGRDPELEDPKPTTLRGYLLEMSGLPWWLGKLKTHLAIAAGRVGAYGFLNADTRPKVIRSVRLQLAVYALAMVASVVLGRPLFILYWLLPVALGQPLLRAILLAEHASCSESNDSLSNTRTTLTLLPVRFLMWEMPYHAEHHRYPALPFFALGRAHQSLRPFLTHVADKGYAGVHIAFVRGLMRRPD
jgi:fatty acid desaturase